MFSRLLLTVVGLACGSAAALLFLPLAVALDPLVQIAASHVSAEHWFDLIQNLFLNDNPQETVATIVQLAWTIGMLVCVLPVTITALIGSVAQARSFIFYASMSGLLAAAMPWILRASRFADRAGQTSPAEAHFTLILFLTGVTAGAVYWLIAARGGGAGHRNGWLTGQTKG